MIRSGEVRALSHPGLQEVSNDPCDTGTPLDELREEFPDIQFLDELFPLDAWPRTRSIELRKTGTIYDDQPGPLLARAVNFRKWLREEVNDKEIIVVTHGGFMHFFYDQWDDVPGDSGSGGFQLDNAQAVPMTLAGVDLPDEGFRSCPLGVYPGPYINVEIEDASDLADVPRDCGIFTPDRLRYNF
jgi:broad specificity phosphatase PhoE